MAEYQVALQDCEGFESRIRSYVRNGIPVFLQDLGSGFDGSPQFGVFVEVKRFFFFGPYRYQIGMVAPKWAKLFRDRIYEGHRIEDAFVSSCWFSEYKFSDVIDPEERGDIEFELGRPLEQGVRASLLVVGSWEMKPRKRSPKKEQWLP